MRHRGTITIQPWTAEESCQAQAWVTTNMGIVDIVKKPNVHYLAFGEVEIEGHHCIYVRRRADMAKKIPGFVRKILPNSASFMEEMTFICGKYHYTAMTSVLLKGKMLIMNEFVNHDGDRMSLEQAFADSPLNFAMMLQIQEACEPQDLPEDLRPVNIGWTADTVEGWDRRASVDSVDMVNTPYEDEGRFYDLCDITKHPSDCGLGPIGPDWVESLTAHGLPFSFEYRRLRCHVSVFPIGGRIQNHMISEGFDGTKNITRRMWLAKGTWLPKTVPELRQEILETFSQHHEEDLLQ